VVGSQLPGSLRPVSTPATARPSRPNLVRPLTEIGVAEAAL